VCFDPEGEIPEGSGGRTHPRMRWPDVEITGIGLLIRPTEFEISRTEVWEARVERISVEGQCG
jgi:hypothetical protein